VLSREQGEDQPTRGIGEDVEVGTHGT
jgi:hypothetical protein